MIRPSHLVRTSLLGAVLSAVLGAQDPAGEGSPDLVQQRQLQKAADAQEAADTAAKLREMKATGETMVATEKGDGPMEAPIAADLAFFMAPVMSFQPRRIAPGATGDAVLVLSMQRGTVLAVGSKFEIEYADTQGPIRLGQYVMGDPAIGAEEGVFRGQPVYENYASVTIPVSVPLDTPHGKYPISARVVADITDGRSGTVQRVAQTQVRAELVVGPALPRSGLSAARPATVGEGAPDLGAADPVDDGGDPGEALSPRAVEPPGPVAARVADAADAAAEPGRSGAVDGPDLLRDRGDPTMLWLAVGGGALVLMLVVLGIRRR